MPHHKPLLHQIVERTRELLDQGQRGLVVFDLDSTLFDVGPRLERILYEFAEIPENQRRFPEQIQHFRNIRVERGDWGIKQALIRAGLDGHHPEFQEKVRDFWREKFFSNEYLVFDKPYPGAVEYVQSLSQAGAEIVYLTGRDVHRMGEGSRQTLLHWNFPLDNQRSHLVLKPHQSMKDSLFKRDWLAQVNSEKFKEIWFFENEPVNIHLVLESLPHVQVIFFDSTHSGQAERPENIPAIMHFLLEEYGRKE